jgi:DNA (cytosine-5)-methyltransferase 1
VKRHPQPRLPMMGPGIVVDLFAGGGGASAGIEAALGEAVDVAVNHDETAIAVHTRNHPSTVHYRKSVYEVDPVAATGGRRVRVLWASPDCTHFSIAKGDVPRSAGIRSLAWVVVEWARAVKPEVIFLENVREFAGWGPLGEDGRPDKARAGETFAEWLAALRELGYAVEHAILNAADFGAPTHRRRLFVVARGDGRPICWPTPTHGPGRARAWRPAAECIDWSIPCPSIFTRARPLAEKTLWRIAEGIRRYVFEAARPFVVKVNHGRDDFRGQNLGEPLSTVTAAQRGHALAVPTLIQTGYGERPGQTPRVPGLDKPIGTIVGCGQKHALVSAFLAKHFGDPRRAAGGGAVIGQDLERPASTVTARDHHALTAATLVKMRGDCTAADVGEPAPTITASGTHLADVRAFLTAYYGTGVGQPLDAPARTLTARHRLGLVTVEGTDYQIVDIGMRMLEPHELLRAQFGDFAGAYDLSPAKTKAAQVRLIGNSVAPNVARALVAANCDQVRIVGVAA